MAGGWDSLAGKWDEFCRRTNGADTRWVAMMRLRYVNVDFGPADENGWNFFLGLGAVISGFDAPQK